LQKDTTMRFAFDRIIGFDGLLFPLTIAIFLSAFALGAQAQNRCSATGVMGTEKFAANNCTVALYEHSVAIWFNENPISAQEAEEFRSSTEVEDKKDGKQRTLARIIFCPGGGGATASAAAVKTIDLHTNHAKSPLVGIQWTVKSPKDFKVVKLSGEIKPGGALAGNIVGSWGKTKFNFDFDVKLPAKEASAGVSCGK
jgi:hypothetical protein